VIYQHPLAFLLGLEGIALMRAFNGDYDEEFTRARIAEIRTLLDSAGRYRTGRGLRDRASRGLPQLTRPSERGATAGPDSARAPVGHLDAPGLVPGRHTSRKERRPDPDLLALPLPR
jgi:hypothetical protein